MLKTDVRAIIREFSDDCSSSEHSLSYCDFLETEANKIPCSLRPVSPTTQDETEGLLETIVGFRWSASLSFEPDKFLKRISKKDTTVSEKHLVLTDLFGQMPSFQILGLRAGMVATLVPQVVVEADDRGGVPKHEVPSHTEPPSHLFST